MPVFVRSGLAIGNWPRVRAPVSCFKRLVPVAACENCTNFYSLLPPCNSTALRFVENDVGGLLGDHIDRARDEEARNAGKDGGVNNAQSPCAMDLEIAGEDSPLASGPMGQVQDA